MIQSLLGYSILLLRFKVFNDAHGYKLGDLLLIAVGDRIAGLLREGDTLASLSADEFAILLSNVGDQREHASRGALSVAEKIRASLHRPFRLAEGNEEATLTASLGIALIPDGANDTPQETLRRAITAGEMRLYLQPQIDAAGQLHGADALVRWQHPERGLLPPGVFIGVAEESDLIVDLGGWVLQEACQLMATETAAGHPLRLSVNISPRQFRQPGFVPWIKDLLAVTGADPTRLTLEITESVVIDSIGAVVAKMEELAALGIHFSIDDFGTGYSSLAYIKRMPIHELKIDKSFVRDAPLDPNDAALVDTILSVARHMHLQVVAEGIETAEQANFLNTRANLIHQGYFYGMPEPAENWLARWRAAATARESARDGL